jgi:exodeoxyribonuclease V gamma subunit
MALFLKVSNSLEKLALRISSDMRDFPGGVFQPDFIITQTSGMNN